ncbi:MAG: DNA-methyltransferase [Candidatus Zixiibacteriota bacterium]
METVHKIHFDNSLEHIEDDSVHLVVTSPPYPMIEMWDECFMNQDFFMENAIKNENSEYMFDAMHKVLSKAWKQLYRIVKPGGIVCINIGDATRNIGGRFQLFPNHSRIISDMLEIGFINLPNIIWRKPSNSPTKFLGSGVLPVNAYATLEHEYILIFRKGKPRKFNPSEAQRRRESAIFWEERNLFYSDIWQIPGIKQKVHDSKTRKRSAAFPLEIPYRLINMYSIYDDTVIDPFCGLGTTNLCAAMLGRNSIGIEIDKNLQENIENTMKQKELANNIIKNRLQRHLEFTEEKGDDFFKYRQNNMPVKTKQETSQKFYSIDTIEKEMDKYIYFKTIYKQYFYNA